MEGEIFLAKSEDNQETQESSSVSAFPLEVAKEEGEEKEVTNKGEEDGKGDGKADAAHKRPGFFSFETF